ncbi:MAG: DUF2059 domain-containing protein [Polaromonas sp.]|nr:DUF2059 domain-containing protein [Polaromonas sp.]
MSKFFIALLFSTLGALTTSSSFAQTPDPKIEWATKVVALQQGPELDRLVAQLTESAVQDLVNNWGPKLDAGVPKARLAKATEEMNLELKKYAEDTQKVIAAKVGGVSSSAMVAAYVERFTLDELKQIAGFFEAPAIKKYQAQAPELGNLFVQKLLEAARPEVVARAGQFNEVATKIVGTPAPAGAGSAPGKAPARK